MEYEWNLCFCQDFGIIKKEGEFPILRSAIASSSHLKRKITSNLRPT
jgi:hypothetical protein